MTDQERIKELEASLQDSQYIKAEWQRKYELKADQNEELYDKNEKLQARVDELIREINKEADIHPSDLRHRAGHKD